MFVLFCVVEPFARVLAGASLDDFKFNDVGWPLVAALLIVGFLPATPLFEKVELAFRQFAHRAAGIPEGFLASIDRLEDSDLHQAIARSDTYAEEAARFNEIRNIGLAAGFSKADANHVAKADLLFALFRQWTLSPSANEIWSVDALATFSDVVAITSHRASRLQEAINSAIRLSLRSDFMKRLLEELRIANYENPIEIRLIRQTQAFDDQSARLELETRWTALAQELDQTLKQLIALFVMLAAKDEKPNATDHQLAEAIDLARRERSKPLYNAAVNAVVGGAIAALVCGSLASVTFARASGFPLSVALSDGVRSGVLTSIVLSIQLTVALAVTLSLYYSRYLSSGRRVLPTQNVSGMEAISLLFYATLCSAAVSFVIYAGYQTWKGNLTDAKALDAEYLAGDLFFILAWSLVPSILAFAFAVVAHKAAQGTLRAKHMPLSIAMTVGAAFVLLILRYDASTPSFWISISSVVALSFVSLLMFRSRLEQS